MSKPGRAEDLLKERVVWIEGTDAARDAVTAAIERRDDEGLHAYVLVLPAKRPIDAAARALWNEMALDSRHDLLLLVADGRWEAKGWSFTPGQIGKLLDGAEGALARSKAEGIEAALDALALASPARQPSRLPWVAFGVGGAAVVGGLAWVIARRRKRAGERQRVEKRLAEAERSYAELVLAAEGLERETAADLQLRGARIKTELDSLRENAGSDDEQLALGRIGQYEDELAQLRSEVLQKERVR